MRAGSLGVGLEPPFRDRIRAAGLGTVGLEDRRDRSTRILATFAGSENYRLSIASLLAHHRDVARTAAAVRNELRNHEYSHQSRPRPATTSSPATRMIGCTT